MKIERENTRFKLATKLLKKKTSATCSNTFKPQCAAVTAAAAITWLGWMGQEEYSRLL